MSALNRIVTFSEFKTNLDKLLLQLADDGEPLVVTRRGRGAFVVQLPEFYTRLERGFMEAQRFHAVQEAVADVEDYPRPTPARDL